MMAASALTRAATAVRRKNGVSRRHARTATSPCPQTPRTARARIRNVPKLATASDATAVTRRGHLQVSESDT